jgi:dihydropteroate synthase
MHWQIRDGDLNIGRRPLVMGIVNVTPDSFSDGGRFTSTDAAIAHGLALESQGADLLDIGGESTRPGSTPVSLEEELRRVVPVVAGLAKQTRVPISVDTSKAEVARASLEAGARIINDVTALTGDAAMPEVVRASGAGAVLMHMQGTPATMQQSPHYDNVITEIIDYLRERLTALQQIGISSEQLALDPGIGFGKTSAHNLEILGRLEEFRVLGRPVCLGVSRKGFLGRLLNQRPAEQRLAGSLAAALFARARHAAHIIRVHDVQETRDALVIFDELERIAACGLRNADSNP